jgi:hypothetical protein
MPKCATCSKRKKVDAFRRGRKYCRQCEVIRVNAHRRQRARQTRKIVFDYLREHPCVDCGEVDIAVLEFDHRDRATKELPVAALIVQGYKLERVMAEIEKCDVRCANCHRRRTAKQLGWYAASAARKRGCRHPVRA